MPTPSTVEPSVGTEDCALIFAIEVLGERWAFLILRAALTGTEHFEQFHRDLGIARNILSNRLGRLVAQGILEREVMENDRRRVRYVLTEKGEDLGRAMQAFKRWGERWSHAARDAGDHGLLSPSTRWGHKTSRPQGQERVKRVHT